MYIIVRYGDGEQQIFNPYCKTHLLLKMIKKQCKCNRDTEIELSDECGNVKYLREYQNKYANELLADRENLVLLKVEREPSSSLISYSPMLHEDDGVLTDDFLSRLSVPGDASTRPSSRRVKSNTRRNKAENVRQNSKDKSIDKLKSAVNKPEKRSRSRQGRN